MTILFPYYLFMVMNQISFYAWGSNTTNQLGLLSDDQCFVVPTKVTLLSTPRTIPLSIAAGGSHAMCLTDDGELYIWGMGDKGQLGMGPSITECITPHTVDNWNIVQNRFPHSRRFQS